MSAHEALSPVQFVPTEQMLQMHSYEYGSSIENVGRAWGGEEGFGHIPDAKAHRAKVSRLARNIKDWGVRKPVTTMQTPQGDRYLADGHHRVLAAHRAGVPSIPVRHWRPELQ